MAATLRFAGPWRSPRSPKELFYQMYDRYMGGAAPPPEPDAERSIVRIGAEKVYQFPPVPTAA